MLASICCIHFHIFRSSHLEVVLKKGVLQIFSQFTEEDPSKSVTSVLLKLHFCMGIALYINLCCRTPSFREHIWGTASLYRSKYREYKCRGSL